MVVSLKRQKFVDSLDGDRVRGLKPQSGATGQRLRRITDAEPPGFHNPGSGNLAIMYESRQPEVATLEGARDEAHVGSDLGHTCRVRRISLESNLASVSQRLELVGRRVLIDTHGFMATRLDPGKRTIGSRITSAGASSLLRLIEAAARQEEHQRDDSG
jgi:hypothetical protein